MPLLAFGLAHKFYVSVTNVNYSDRDQTLQVTTRIFVDDLEAVLEERYGIKSKLATPEEISQADAYIEKYLKAKLVFYVNDKLVQYTYLGKEFDTDIVICYLEVQNVNQENLVKIEVQNEVLTDLFEEQQNIVHLKIAGKKKSFILIKENNKGMLNF